MSETNSDIDQMRQKFEDKLRSIKLRINSFLIQNANAYENLIFAVEEAKTRIKKTYTDYRRLKRYDVLTIGECKKLIRPLLKNETNIKYYAHNEQLFDIIHAAHLETGHGGKHKLENNIKMKYVNITREVIYIYLELCLICKKKKAHLKKDVVTQPMVFKEINQRAQVDLIDIQMSPDGEYKFILIYQEHLTKFVCLRPLKTDTVKEVAYNLIDIFCVIGVPSVLQSDKGREFCKRVIEALKDMWPDLKIVHGKPRQTQSQDSIECPYQDVHDILVAWMKENNLTTWSLGLRFCQWKKNNSWHSAIKQTPYEAMFGRKAHIGLQSSQLPSSVINNLITEEELEEVIYSTDGIHFMSELCKKS